MSEPTTQRDSARRYLAALFGSAPARSLVEVRFRVASGMGRRFDGVSALDRVVEAILALSALTDVYVGVLPRRRRGGGRADLIERAGVVWADCDTSASVRALRAFRLSPGMVVASSEENRHAYWFLTEPVPLDVIERTNRRIALALGADVRCSDPARILRPSGSVNRKRSEPAIVRLLRLTPTARVFLDDLEPQLPPEPEPPRFVRSQRSRLGRSDPLAMIPPPVYFEQLTGQRVSRSGKIRCPFHDLSVGRAGSDGVSPARSLEDASLNDRAAWRELSGSGTPGRPTASPDRLRLVPPPVYFERLTGLRVGRSGKLRCFFHDDRVPSLHVYREPERGWYCFGCGRGGSIYDLAALLSGRSTRGSDFRELRRELESVFL